ncbi:MAG: tRNA pseudouridine(55) synthase TruB [Candidatus Andersenbacteria bacterium CG10_big_fil_rev_8_21_14_0_10_54_11]|uniref:tRNA pseudouridine synthase B n=1 Tax=Candidatus Andersenbacteria bacterium CG10_big_fil_rev_8_21_14_0_10_54_11 TaxID=1974485 RepID=A0A2M6WYC4_9BACT|nr:MAG: tRNA pseudouridine(55) synthase TruB [Candidatus Andersenbacteria bacterium CG10_big_fil_rev_8_21_14_0_10_54_11]
MSKPPAINGFFLIDKPAGPTSHDIVARVRRLLRQALGSKLQVPKIGHTGTLDPAATGLLIITVGAATRLAEYTRPWPKTYRARFTLGAGSDTDDAAGTLQYQSDAVPERAAVIAALDACRGPQQQVPPAYAAIKFRGRKLYELARQGIPAPRLPRLVTIYTLTLKDYTYPQVEVEVSVSAGTYIRSLARDLGEDLNTGAYLANLRRTAIGPFDLNEVIHPDEMSAEILFTGLRPPAQLVQRLTRCTLPRANVAQFITGQAVQGRDPLLETPPGPVAVFDPHHTLVGIGRYDASSTLHPEKVFPPPAPPGE